MIVCVTTEHRFYRTTDGAVWTDGPFARPFWDRYLEVFDGVRVIARVADVVQSQPTWVRSDGNCVTFASVPYYIGVGQYLRKWWAIRQAVWNAVEPDDAVILRVPSPLAMILSPRLLQTKHPYAVEVVGDPYDAFAPGTVRHPLRSYLRWRLPQAMRRQCKEAMTATYVTSEALQRRYPAKPGARRFEFSDVQLDERIAAMPRGIASKKSWTLVTVGSLAHLYKAQDVLVDAVGRCREAGLDLRLVIAGDGKYRQQLEARASARGIRESVDFLGQLSAGDEVGAVLQAADLFLLPSRQEGLPRALIEAMALGLPCIGSHVGGIPELLPIEDRVAAGDVAGLAEKIREVVTDPDRMRSMSARNLERARDFTEGVLREKRLAFYRYVRERAPLANRSRNVVSKQLVVR